MNCFSKSSLQLAVGIGQRHLENIIARYPDFPIVYRNSRSHIIPKRRFFEWYDRHRDEPMVADRFDHYSIEALRQNTLGN